MRAHGLATRLATVLAGSLVSTICYAVTIRATIGLGPLYVLQDGISRQLGITIGHAVMVTGVALLVLACALRWRPGPFTVVLPFLGGAALDALLPHVPQLHGTVVQIVAVALASWTMALGGALMIRAAVGYAAYDGVMMALHRSTGIATGRIRLAMEAAVLAAGWLLGGAVGLGTVLTGVLIGPALQFWLRIVRATPGPRPAPAPAPAQARPAVAAGD